MLRAVGVSPNQLVTLLEPTGGMIPTNNAQYQNLVQRIRGMGHILENTPGNLASHLA